jgi:hypothetical protein
VGSVGIGTWLWGSIVASSGGLASTVTTAHMVDVRVSGLSGAAATMSFGESSSYRSFRGQRGTGGGWWRYEVEEAPPQPQAVD